MLIPRPHLGCQGSRAGYPSSAPVDALLLEPSTPEEHDRIDYDGSVASEYVQQGLK